MKHHPYRERTLPAPARYAVAALGLFVFVVLFGYAMPLILEALAEGPRP